MALRYRESAILLLESYPGTSRNQQVALGMSGRGEGGGGRGTRGVAQVRWVEECRKKVGGRGWCSKRCSVW